jgi:glycosyltransferase involved in cell wall biosynthesis
MRIGMILDKSFPPDPRVENEALTLIESGHEVFLFCLTYTKEYLTENYNGIQLKRYHSNNITYKLSALAYEIPFYSRVLKPKIKDFLKANHIDVIHIHDMRIAGTVFLVNEKFKLPIVLDLHDNFPEVMKEYPHLKKFPGKYVISPKKWLKKEQEFIEKADKIVTVSQEFVDSIKNRLLNQKDKVVLVPNSVRRSFYTNVKIDKTITNKFKDDFVLLYIGDTGLRRGLQTVIEAIPIIKQTINTIRLVIVGKSTTDHILVQLAEKLNVTENISFEGWQNEQLFSSYIKAAHIGISPLIRSKQHDVAYANKLFQYMGLGLPLLVSDATAQKKLVEKNNTGLIHEEKNPSSFAKKVSFLYANKELRSTFATNAKSFIENKFHWELTSKELVKMYNEIE